MCLQILFQYSYISVALGFFHHWKMLWVWPGGMGKSNFPLLPGQPLAVIKHLTWISRRSELAFSSPSVGSVPQPLAPPERRSQWATIRCCSLQARGVWVSKDSNTFSKKSWLISNLLTSETEKNPTDTEKSSSNTWRAPSPQMGLHLC